MTLSRLGGLEKGLIEMMLKNSPPHPHPSLLQADHLLLSHAFLKAQLPVLSCVIQHKEKH